MKKEKKISKEEARIQIGLAILFINVLMIVLLMIPAPDEVIAQTYYSNTTVITKLNISNAAPVVSDVYIYDNDTLGGSPSIILTPGTTDRVTCNATVNDTNGWGDLLKVNGTLFINGNVSSPNDKNVKYRNDSCIIRQNGAEALSAIASCTFEVAFFANNGTWNCSIWAFDNQSATDQAYDESGKEIAPLYAIDLNKSTLDYGKLNVTQSSALKPLGITNAGNMDINISVEGYGSSLHDGLSMNCSYGSTINVTMTHYSITPYANWSMNMTTLTSDALTTGMGNLTIIQNQDDNGNSTNTTYWSIYAPIGAQSGACNGSLLFSAIPA